MLNCFTRYCPPCQHATLVERLQENLKSFETLLKKRDADNKRKERLAFVSLSLSNIIPKTGASKSGDADEKSEKRPERKSRRRRIDSGSSSDDSSDSSSGKIFALSIIFSVGIVCRCPAAVP